MIAFDLIPQAIIDLPIVVDVARVIVYQLQGINPIAALMIVGSFMSFVVISDLYAPIPGVTAPDQDWRWAPY